MPALHKKLRDQLSKAILDARQAAEAGARKALESLAVDHHEPHGSMTPADRDLRRRLRARGRQLGDTRDIKSSKQTIGRLTHEVAYEQWHRMLFARFLAENHLLIHPEHGVSVSLEDVEEFAREAGKDPNDLAAAYAQDALPQIFRQGDPVLEVGLAPETRQSLNKLVVSLPAEVFTADDSLGWTYQFWQADKKEEVNKSGVKIGADELPAVTQLFTEHYMVLFLLHNTVGAWWAGKKLAENPDLSKTAKDENELRAALRLDALGGYDFEYLRFVREKQEGDEDDKPTGDWKPAAGTFDGWPNTVAELTVLDPCCGSGHFLVAVLDLLVRLHMQASGLSVEDAIEIVLRDNLFGLELDPRCTQIAAFNVALAAWKLAGGPVQLPALNIACSGLAPNAPVEKWHEIVERELRDAPSIEKGAVRIAIDALHQLFKNASVLGSLINVEGDATRPVGAADWDTVEPYLRSALEHESTDDAEALERAVSAQGIASAARILAGPNEGYTLVITNVPYLARGSQHTRLQEYIEKSHKLAKADLATAFLERSLQWLSPSAVVAAVAPQNWLYTTGYKNYRKKILTKSSVNLVARLGPGAFETIGGQVVNVALFAISSQEPDSTSNIAALDVSDQIAAADKILKLRSVETIVVNQQRQIKNSEARVLLEKVDESHRLTEHADYANGLQTCDYPRHIRYFWETSRKKSDWSYFQSTVKETAEYGGLEQVIEWGINGDLIQAAQEGAVIRGAAAWGKPGVAVSAMNELKVALYSGEPYDDNTVVLYPKIVDSLPAIWARCSSVNYNHEVRKVDQALKVRRALLEVPFDLEHWQEVAVEKYPNGLPEPESEDPTQWLFHGRPDETQAGSELQVSVGRLLGYRWPAELDKDMRLSDRARGLASSCDELLDHADDDGIVCLAATKSEQPAAQRIRKLLADAYGAAWSPEKEKELLASAEAGNATLEEWLRDKFFEQHCKLFHHRPFVWHLWDGNRDGFHCLVNAHKLCAPGSDARKTLELITYTYLGDWINRQQADQQDEVEGADARLAAAQDLQDQLKKILAGEPPYDLFVRWKPLHEQPIGWEPDINDGVRMNIRPFMMASLRKGGKKGAGLLRWKPNIKWTKDRGKEPQRPKDEYPWFWSCEDGETDFMGGKKFDGNRWNDLHYSKAVREVARAAAAEKQAEESKA